MSDARAVIRAAESGDLAALRELIAADPGLLEARDSDGSTALHCAVWKGYAEVVAWLLGHGADVRAHNANDHWGTTALHAAAHANHAAVVELLIAHGADVHAADAHGRTPLDHTEFHRAARAARLLRAHGARLNP